MFVPSHIVKKIFLKNIKNFPVSTKTKINFVSTFQSLNIFSDFFKNSQRQTIFCVKCHFTRDFTCQSKMVLSRGNMFFSILRPSSRKNIFCIFPGSAYFFKNLQCAFRQFNVFSFLLISIPDDFGLIQGTPPYPQSLIPLTHSRSVLGSSKTGFGIHFEQFGVIL